VLAVYGAGLGGNQQPHNVPRVDARGAVPERTGPLPESAMVPGGRPSLVHPASPRRSTVSNVPSPPSRSRLATAGARVLRTRWLMRAPIRVYKARLGFLFGSRMLMLEHIGRNSGARRYVVLEVFGHPAPDIYLVVSGFGTQAQWYRNLQANPSARVWVRGRRALPATAELLSDPDADAALDAYVARHAKAWEKLKSVVENTLGRTIERGSDIPVIALRLDSFDGRIGTRDQRSRPPA